MEYIARIVAGLKAALSNSINLKSKPVSIHAIPISYLGFVTVEWKLWKHSHRVSKFAMSPALLLPLHPTSTTRGPQLNCAL